MSESGYKVFKKRDFGQFVYMTVAVCLAAAGVLMLVQKDIGMTWLQLGLKIFLLVCGLGIISGYFLNSRTRFRPGWTLPTGIIFTFIGGGYLILDSVPTISSPSVSTGTFVMFFAFINGCLLLSTSIQLFSLRLKRWTVYLVYSLLSFGIVSLIYIDAFTLKTNSLIACAVYMFLLAAQLVTEAVIDLLKVSRARISFFAEENK